MFAPSRMSLLNLLEQCRTIPVVENRAQLGFVLDKAHVTVILLKHCNLFELEIAWSQFTCPGFHAG